MTPRVIAPLRSTVKIGLEPGSMEKKHVMNAKSWLLLLVLVVFGGVTAVALKEHGYWGIISFHFTSSAGLQVILDLVIVCVLAIAWMVSDARKTGRIVWPFVVLTLALGSFGPLIYLLMGQWAGRSAETRYA